MKKEILNHVYKMLREHPEEWKFTKYEATYKNIEIWLCNRYYHTEFNVGSIHIGGSNILWMLKPWEWWRVKLIKEVEKSSI